MSNKNTRMHVTWNKEDGFKLDVPYSGWLMFCIGLSLLLGTLPSLIDAIRWW